MSVKILPSLQQLRFLCAVAEHRSFSRAADACSVTQSTLSGGIKDLEDRLGIRLCERSSRTVLITPIGQDIVLRARRLLADAEDLVDAAHHIRTPLSGPLRFGVIPTIAPYLLPRLMPTLRNTAPKLKLYVREDQSGLLVEKLTNGDLDLLMLALPFELGAVETMAIVDDPIVVAMPHDHPLCRRQVVDREDLARAELLLMEDGHCLRSHALQACRIVDPLRNETFQATSLRILVQMVAAGLGITLMPRIAVESELALAPNVTVRPVAPNEPSRTLALAWRPTSPRAAEFRQFGQILRHCLTGRSAEPGASPPSSALLNASLIDRD